MLLLTGATGRVGSALLRRLARSGTPVRCLVRDPRRLGPDRVRVQLAIGDLADPSSFRNALRGVSTVVHLAASERDQPHGTIEEVDGVAVWRLLRAAERSGVEHFIFPSMLGATPWHRSRVLRAKALAEEAVAGADLRTTTLRCSLIYSPGDRQLALIDLLSLLPVVPVTATMARARAQPIAADDVAACIAALATAPPGPERHAVLELAGPQELTHREAVEEALRIKGHRRRVVPIPSQLLRRALGAYSALVGPVAFTSPDEADLLAATLVSERGTRDAEALGVRPRRLAEALG
jgi:NADH dehydrogenase